jgi:transcriptional regulator GlxA family with amidase domain
MQVAFLLYEGFTALDIVGPYDVLRNAPGVEPVFVAQERGEVRTESGTLALMADASLAEVTSPEILVVPGGFGNRVLLGDEPLLSWLRTVHESTTWTTSVCTGSLLLAAAGLLDGIPAATHWLSRQTLASLGALPSKERVIQHDKIMTAAGVSAGIDMALRLVALTHGDLVAQAIQLAIEYDPDPPFDTGSPDRAPARVVDLARGGFAEEQRACEERAAFR